MTMDMTDKEKTCCFSGYRPGKLPWGYEEEDPRCSALKEVLAGVLHALYESGYRHFLCGMAEGADLYFGEAVLALREERPDVTLEAVIPFEGQELGWAAASVRRYNRVAEGCDRRTVLHGSYAREHFLERDRRMVDRSSLLIAVYDGKRGGTQYTVRYAEAQGVEIIQLPPVFAEQAAPGP